MNMTQPLQPVRRVSRLKWFHRPSTSLEGKHLVLQLADGPGLLEPEGLGGLLETAHHGRRAAQQDLDVGRRLGEPFLRWR